MKCLECGWETTETDYFSAQKQGYKHMQAEHPAEWEKFMDWVLN